MRICIVLSSGGSVVNEVLNVPTLKKNIYSIVTDRECNAQRIAADNRIKLQEIFTKNNLIFSDSLLEYCKKEKIDIIISFHVRLYKGSILREYKNRIINFHLSPLPAFPGLNSFENAVAYGVKFLGTTVHFIDETMDMGLPIIQSIVPNNPALSKTELRHQLFVQQCKMLIQIIFWLNENRILVNGNVCIIRDVKFDNHEFAPALDSLVALSFRK